MTQATAARRGVTRVGEFALRMLGVVVLGAVLAGCAFGPKVCSAVGWLNKVTVEISGSADAVELVRVCADDVCSSAPTLPSDAPLVELSAAPLPEPATPAPPAPLAEEAAPYDGFDWFSSQEDADTWTVTIGMAAPSNVTVQALSADGVVLAETMTDLVWTRVGGSAECGGPGAAGPVTLVVP